ncbi:DUF4340 domain-containing protein [Magnetofaba australis]|nr:DUF4340 domain-containing protein [Magnetofaba australis]
MSSGWRLNLILLAVVVVGFGVLLGLQRHEEGEKRADERSRALSALKPEQIASMSFTDREGTQLTLTRQQSGWAITAPKPLRTDADSAARLLEPLEKRYARLVGKVEDLAPFGLDKPSAKLTVSTKEGQSETLILGGVAPVSSKRYVQLGEGGDVALVAAADLSALVQTADDLRDKRLFPAWRSDDVTRIAVFGKQGDVVMVKSDKGEWALQSPYKDRASLNRAPIWVNTVTNSVGMSFVPAPPPPENPEWRAELTNAKGDSVAVSGWQVGDKLLALRPGEDDAIVIPEYVAEDIQRDPLSLSALRPLLGNNVTQLALAFVNNENYRAERNDKGQWERPLWKSFEELATREAFSAVKAGAELPDPWFVMTVGNAETAQAIPVWKQGEAIYLAPPQRPVWLKASPLQVEEINKAVAALRKQDGAAKPTPVSTESASNADDAQAR